MAGVYRIGCNSCPKKYVGESERDIQIRIKEHEADVANKRIKTSPVADHMCSNIGHYLDANSYELLELEYRKFHRKFKEHLNIMNEPQKMNISNGMKISPFWTEALLPLYKSSH